MKKYLSVVGILLAITILGGILRFYKITQNPPSLNGDEISFGYSAYSIIQTGRDEYGKFLPLVFQSVGDYKNPVPVYLMVLPIKLLGLTDFAVRLPNAIFGTIFIPFYFLFLLYLSKDKKIALLGSLFMALSSWFIFYSRFAYEPLIGSFFAFLGIWFYMKMLEGQKKFIFLSAFFLVLTMYTAFAPRLFIPLFIFVATVFNLRKFKSNWVSTITFLSLSLAFVLPLAYVTLYKGASTRFSMVFIGNDIEFSRYILLKYFTSVKDIPLLIFFWVRRYLNYLQPDFIFFNGLHMTTLDSFGLGILYQFELPFLILGIAEFIKKKIPHKQILMIWLFTGIIPDSLTNNQQQGGRLLHIAPVVLFITTLGAIRFFKWISEINKTYLKIFITVSFTTFAILMFMHAFLVFDIYFPRDKGEYYDEGLKAVSIYVNAHKDEYQRVIIDPRHGIAGPTMIANPFLYILFYGKYDPAKYQTESKIYGTAENPDYRFDKYEFRYIEWPTDKNLKKTLFVGSPWSFPDNIDKNSLLLDKVYLSNGLPAYYILTTK